MGTGESISRRHAASSENIGTIVPRKFQHSDLFRKSKFGRVVETLWPDKPALNLAQRAAISERMAQYIIDGKRKPNTRAALVVYAEIIS